MIENLDKVNEWLDLFFQMGTVWVYLVIFFACFIENLFPPFPGDTFIVAAGILVGLERLDLITSVLVIITGGVLSVLLIYLFGRSKGYSFFRRKNYFLFSREDMVKSRLYFQNYGAFILIISRFVVGFRSALALAAGVSRYDAVKMVVYTALSYILFTSLLFYATISLVENFDLLAKYVKTYNWIVFPLLIILLLFYIFSRFKSKKERK